MASGTVTINIVGDASRLKSALGDADSHLGSFSSRVGRLGETMAGVFGGLTLDRAAQGVVSFFRGAFAEAEESIKVTRETARVIETMGGVANVTAAQVEKLATAISNKTGVDDEAIQSASNLLLTFGNIRNEVGKGNKIFDQATKLSLDMATVMKTDARSAALTLGKALNDPVSGLTALRRAGVQFTDQQEAQIKAMVASGDILGAQKLILAELSREFAGAAEASATPFEKLQTRFKNVQEAIGLKLMPVLVSVSEWFLRSGIPAIERFVAAVRQNWPQVQAAFEKVWTVIEPIVANMVNRVKAIADGVKEAVGLVKAIIDGDWKEVWERLKGLAGAAIDGVYAFFLELPLKVIGVLGDLGGQLLSKGAELLGSLVTGLVHKLPDVAAFFLELPMKVVGWIGDVTGTLVSKGIDFLVGLLTGLAGKVGEVASWFAGLAPQVPGWVGDAFGALIGKGAEFIAGLLHGAVSAVGELLAWFAGLPQSIAEAVGDAAGALIDKFENLGARAGNAFRSALGSLIPDLGFGGSLDDEVEKRLKGTQRRASGGPVYPGTWLVGERGPELLTLGAGATGFVTPNHALGSGGGQTVINLTVNAGMGADGPALGQKIVEVIKQYENRSGTRWRNN